MVVTTQARSRTGAARAAGTCGELAQGVLPDGRSFHVSLPIDRFASARVRVTPAPETQIVGLPAERWKTHRALARAAELLELAPAQIDIDLHSDLDPAKGLASSSADIVAAVRALAVATGAELDASAIGALAAAVEPTDGVMYDGIACVDQRSGLSIRSWAWWPQFAIAMVVPAAQRETGRRGAPLSRRHAGDYADLLAQLDEAAARHDADAFARQATRSARLSRLATPNPLAEALLPRLGAAGAAGLCVGHSGTVCGLLFTGDEAAARAAHAVGRLRAVLPRDCVADVVRTPPSPGAVAGEAVGTPAPAR